MKKLLLLLTVCVTLTSCSSAGSKPSADNTSADSSSSVSEGSTLNNNPDEIKSELLQMTNCYKKEKFTLPDNNTDYPSAFQLDDGSIVLIGSDKNDYEKILVYKYDKDFTQCTPINFSLPAEAVADVVYTNPYFNPDGSFNVIVILNDHGGVVAPKEFDESFDYESYNENCITSYMLCTYDKDGNLLTSCYFSYPDELYDEYGYVESGAPVADGDSILQSFSDGSLRRISPTGEITTVYEIENPNDYAYFYPMSLFYDRDGKIICMMSESVEEYDSDGYSSVETKKVFRELTDNGISDEILYSCQEYELFSSAIFGRGDYRFFVPTQDGLVGITDDRIAETAIDWLDSSLEPMSVIPCGETDFLGIGWNDTGVSIVKLVPRDMSELANVEIITVSNCDSTIINEFNNSSDKYRVQLMKYPYDDNNEQLNMDIISGDAPDIICGLDYSTYLNYRNKGLFADLYGFMDDGLSKDMIMPNVITALESSDGKLNALCTSFDVDTLVAKTKFCDKENWTFSDMLNLYDNAPVSATHIYDGQTKLDTFRTMFYAMNDLIDYDNAVCNFNSPEFIQMLEFCNRFVDSVDSPDKWNDSEAWSQYNYEKFHWLGNDQILVEPLSFHNITQYNLVKHVQGNGEDLTIVGYPSGNGKGGRITPDTLMSITEKCENKQGAWEFLKFYILEANEITENTGGYSNILAIPSLTDSFEKAMEIEMNTMHSSSGVEYPAYTQEESDMIADYIKSCDSIGTVLDSDIVAICEEEAGAYFAGEQTVETSAENIQNRVSILISERA
ncbi:MAG: extracellular solute-binding protein [Ruminococcus flavefaciens]|nr:extracellular solute-binding protein [Ruminococcus flavefaciens]